MAEGFFEKVYNDPDDENNYEIICQLKKKSMGCMPPKQKELFILVAKTNNIIKNLPEFNDIERQEARALRKYKRKKKKEEREKKRISKKTKKDTKPYSSQEPQPPAPETENLQAAQKSQNEDVEQKTKESASASKAHVQVQHGDAAEQEDKKEDEQQDVPKNGNPDSGNEEEGSSESSSDQNVPSKREKEDKEIDEKIKGANRAKVIYTQTLIDNARAGLTGINAQPELAIEAIRLLREEIVLREGGKIKNRNFSRLGVCAFSMALLFAALSYFIRLVSEGMLYANTMFADIVSKISIYPYLMVFAGAVIGAWVGFGAESKTISFSQLALVHKDRLKSIPRLVLFGVSGALLLLLIKSGIIELNLGKVTNEVLMQSTGYQVLFGAIAGLLGNRLTTGLVEKAKDLFNFEDDIELKEEECYEDFIKQNDTEETNAELTVSFTNKDNVVTAAFTEVVFANNDKTGTLCESDFVVSADCGSPTFAVNHEGERVTVTIDFKDLKSGDKAYTAVTLKAESAFDIHGKACPQTPYNFTYTVPENKKQQKTEKRTEK